MSNNLTNNQSHELKLWEIFLARLGELESFGGLDRMKVKPILSGFSITAGEIVYTIILPPTTHPLRITISQGDKESRPLPFKKTRATLLQVIEEIERQVSWARLAKELREEDEADVQPPEEEHCEEQEPQAHYLGNRGDVCGFVIYE